MNLQFRRDLIKLLNTYGVDSQCSMADDVLADYLISQLSSLIASNSGREMFTTAIESGTFEGVEVHVDGVKDAN